MKHILFFMVLGLMGCATTPRYTDRMPERVIDAHIHTEFTGELEDSSKIPMTREQLMKDMREANVVGAVAHVADDGGNDHDMRKQNIIHCGGIGARPDLQKLESGLKSGRYGCLKIYLGYNFRYANDPLYHPVYKLAQKYDVPVVFHTGDTYTADGKLKYSHPLTLDEVAVDFRKVKFVIAHAGNPWIRSAAEVAYKNPNVYIEASAMLIGDIKQYSREELETYVIEPIRWAFHYVEDPSKFMFGTDWPLVNIKAYLDVYKQAIPEKHWDAVFHDNAVKLFKFPTSKPAKEVYEEKSLSVVR